MLNFYIDRIQNGLMTINDVPNLWRTKVKDKLSEFQLDTNTTNEN